MNTISATSTSERLKQLLLNWGWGENWSTWISDFFHIIIIVFISVIIYYILKIVINHVLRKLITRSRSKWDDHLYHQKVFTRLSLLVPAMIIDVSLNTTMTGYTTTVKYFDLGIKLYMAAVVMLTINSFLSAAYHIYSETESAATRPIKGYLQIAKMSVYVVGFVIIISILLGQSPLSILAGLGAISAVLLLIFKDSILGFVAGVQISTNNLLQVGDWITMPSYNIDGIVTDISLVIVKVRNFDNSVGTIPSYSLVTDSFQNWRDLAQNGGRRIKRHILIDAGSIRFMSETLLERIKPLDLPPDLLSKTRNLTNLGVFRMYLMHYLRNHPAINKEMSIVSRELQATETGIPVEILAFSTLTDFFEFEMFLSELFEYIYASMEMFDLMVYQRPSYTSVTTGLPERGLGN